jgi:hypothetical protein
LKINGKVLYQLFKYSIYGLLTINVFVFFGEEVLATRLEYPDGVTPGDFFKAYAATVDTAAWVILLLMFELETWVLEDRHFTRAVALSLHALRAVCYLFIVSAFYGYAVDAIFVYQTSPLPGISELCALAGQNWSYATTFGEYAEITVANCASFTDLDVFQRFDGTLAVVDNPGLADIRFLAWVDVVNAAVWLLVVLLLEADVRLQERNLYEGLALFLSLWLVAFVFIELNVFEWRQESHEAPA